MIKIILLILVIGYSIYYINNYFSDSWLLTTLYSFPKTIGMIVALMAIMFPRDYDKIPDMVYSIYKNNK